MARGNNEQARVAVGDDVWTVEVGVRLGVLAGRTVSLVEVESIDARLKPHSDSSPQYVSS